jgi:radical SAM protein with 4Fe4S-binding SPASM domain
MHADTLKFYKYIPVKKPIYKGKFCSIPFDIMQIDEDGDVMLCGCQLHMPYVIGNIYKDTLQNIWLGEKASQVRQSVIDEEFTYCNWACSALPALFDRPEILPTLADFPKTIKIDLDRSCNLKCPSCRESVIMEKYSPKIDKQIDLYKEIVQWAKQNTSTQISIIPLASGEIFASYSGLQFLRSLIDYPHDNIHLTITTNGTLLNKNQELIKNIKHLIKHMAVSIDAATPETYNIVRGGDWSELMLGLEFIQSINIPSLHFSFCIQKNNWHEIKLFPELANKFNALIIYQKLLDWGHWNDKWWHENNVFDRKQDTFAQAIDDLKQVQEKYPNQIGMAAELTKYLNKQNHLRTVT